MRIVRIDSGAGVELWIFSVLGRLVLAVVLAADFEGVLHLCRTFTDSDGEHCADTRC
jgi:hypothetical protein